MPSGTSRRQIVDEHGAADAPYDVVIVGGGIAGLTVALTLPTGLRVALLTKAALGESNTRYAQGGLAVALGSDDNPALHLRDTLVAGAGLVDQTAAQTLVSEGREAVAWLIAAGTHFDARADATPNADGATQYDLTLEAAHSRHRVLHARDATGAEIERALVAALRARPHVVILEHALALRLTTQNGACTGVEMRQHGIERRLTAARGVVLANGGTGQLWLHTSNPEGATADGMALAWRAGATLADMEFAQFHPTVLVPPNGRGEPFLISEAVRGEGAHLRNAAGERFMARYSPLGELAPRDVVARAILSEMLAEHTGSAFLDLRHLDAAEVHARFPTIAAACARCGLDLARDLIPVAPAAHYFMGGVVVDTEARATVPRLYAVGEVACTGVHGANRLASNSLLEGLVFGRRAALALAATTPDMPWPTHSALPGDEAPMADIVAPHMDASLPVATETREALQEIMWRYVSLRRVATGLQTARRELARLADAGPYDPETANMLLVAQLIATSALSRMESRGGHFRVDYPDRDAARDGRHSLMTRAPSVVAAPVGEKVGVHG